MYSAMEQAVCQHRVGCLFSLHLRDKMMTGTVLTSSVRVQLTGKHGYRYKQNRLLFPCPRSKQVGSAEGISCCTYSDLRDHTVQRASTGESLPILSLWQVMSVFPGSLLPTPDQT